MRWLVPLAAAVALALAGCGGSPLSTSALRTRAARVCRLANGRAGQIPTPTRSDRGITFLARGMAVLQPELRALSKLHPDAQAEPGYATALRAFARELDTLKATAAGLRRGEDPVIAVKTLQHQLAPIESRQNSAWDRLEIRACGAR